MEDKVVIDILKELRNEFYRELKNWKMPTENVVTIQFVIESHSYMKT